MSLSGSSTIQELVDVINQLQSQVASALANAETANNNASIVDGSKIPDNTIENHHMADNSIGSAEIIDGSVLTPKYANGSVTTLKIADGNVTAVKLDSGLYNSFLLKSRALLNGIDADINSENPLSSVDLNNVKTVGEYYFEVPSSHGIIHSPNSSYGGVLKVWRGDVNNVFQIVHQTNGIIATRSYFSGSWTPWYFSVSTDQVDALTSSILDAAWPLGSVYENANNGANPSSVGLLGFGTWVPYAEGRVTVGYASGDPDFGSLGQQGGTKTVSLTGPQNGPHRHYVASTLHDFKDGGYSYGQAVFRQATEAHNYEWITTEDGSGSPHANIQPYIVSRKWYRIA